LFFTTILKWLSIKRMAYFRISPFLAAFASFAVFAPLADASPLSLSSAGKTSHVIALANDAIPAEKKAAEQLQKYLQEITGAKFDIKSESDVPSTTPRIFVGPGEHVRKMLPNQDWESLGTDGIVLKREGQDLILAGGRPRGTLYAVFEFLEKQAGVRWWTSKESHIPNTPELKVGELDITYRPVFDYRDHYTTEMAEDPKLATIFRENGTYQKQPPEWGGFYKLIGWVHTSFHLLPPSEYFAKHPDWYSDAANENKPSTASSVMPNTENSQLCFTNPAVADEMAKRVIEAIRTNPDNYTRDSRGYIAVDENDNGHYCACENCRTLAAAEGSESGPVVHFVNSVASKVKEEYPNFLIETLAYRGSIRPPNTLRPAENVIIRLAPLQADFSRPHNTDRNAIAPEVTEPARDYLIGWGKITPQVFVWNYVTNFQYTMLPYPNWDGLAEDLRFFAANKVTSIFQQGDSYTNGVGDFVQLRTWVLSKLMWDPQLDQSKLMDEFLAGYYGAAAPYLREYIEHIKRKFIESDQRLSSYHRDFTFLDLAAMNRAAELMNQASDAVRDNPELSERVRLQRIPLDLLWVYRYQQYKQIADASGQLFLGPKNWADAVAKVDQEARHFGVRLWQEQWDGTGTWPEEYARILEHATRRAALPEDVQKLVKPGQENVDVVNLQASDFIVLKEKVQTERVDDADASNGRAIKVVGTSYDWYTSFNLKYLGKDFFKDDEWRFFINVRVKLKEGANLSGKAFETGIYAKSLIPERGTGNVFHQVVPLAKLADGKYHLLDFGTARLPDDSSFWFAGPGNSEVEAVFLDRVILVRTKK